MFSFIRNGLLLFFILIPITLLAQNAEINQLDSNGKRHGKWAKTFEGTNQIRYEGEFNHGKETGTFKFYKKGNEDHPHATKTYTPNSNIVEAKFFTNKGKLLTQGQFVDKKREGEWIYYHKGKDVVMMKENYKNNKLNGLKSIYYENGKLAETQEYANGVMHGENLVYGANGNLLQYYNYNKGTLHGLTKIYNPKGVITQEGNYKDGLKDGIWKYYEDGEVTKTEKFPKEKPTVRKTK